MVLLAATEADKASLLGSLDAALTLLLRENPDDVIAMEASRVIHAMLPERPALVFAPNVVYVAPERWQRGTAV